MMPTVASRATILSTRSMAAAEVSRFTRAKSSRAPHLSSADREESRERERERERERQRGRRGLGNPYWVPHRDGVPHRDDSVHDDRVARDHADVLLRVLAREERLVADGDPAG